MFMYDVCVSLTLCVRFHFFALMFSPHFHIHTIIPHHIVSVLFSRHFSNIFFSRTDVFLSAVDGFYYHECIPNESSA